MKRVSTTLILTGIIVLLAAGLIGVLIYMKNQPAPLRAIQPLREIARFEADSSKWGVNFPNQFSTLGLTESNNTRTTFGGSSPVSKLEEDPRLVTIFAGNAFSKDYNEERGHANSLTDVNATQRLNLTNTEKPLTPATCYSCKSSNNPGLWDEMGMQAYDAILFSDMSSKIVEPIGCANCHDPATMALVVTNPALEEALVAQGKDWRTFTRQEMRTVVCANCHVEYYFKTDKEQGLVQYLIFPWVNGTKIENIAQYYADLGFKDFVHAESGAPMIKMQHPEYEMYTAGSTHYNAGVACADCHMPYTRDGAAKFSTHNVQSPLLNAETACGACHTDVAYVTGRVTIIQDTVYTTMIATEDALVAAITTIKAAAASPNVDATLLAEAQNLHREAQLRWDFVAAENSMGFHNPEEALRILAIATDLARQAQLKAVQAAGVEILSGAQ